MQVKSYKAGSVGQVDFDEAPFGGKVLYRTLKDAVVMHQANQRQGTAKTKGRSEVKGTNKKPYRQKHTGRARAGDVKSPIWRGGGTVFGPHPRDFSYHMPIKARRVALRGALAGKLADGEVVIADLGGFSEPSAKAAPSPPGQGNTSGPWEARSAKNRARVCPRIKRSTAPERQRSAPSSRTARPAWMASTRRAGSGSRSRLPRSKMRCCPSINQPSVEAGSRARARSAAR